MSKTMKLTFHGGAGSVTGSNFLIENEEKRILVDCGIFQGSTIAGEKNREPFAYDPSTIDFLFITHAHIDHIGRIPQLIKQGFKGKIISTPPTKDIAEIMLLDSMGVLAKEAREEGVPPLYDKQDVIRAMNLWETHSFHKQIQLGDQLHATLRIAGHVLGSAMVEISYNNKRIVFTGDLGNSPTPLLKDTEVLSGIDYLVMESVYGDRNHEERSLRKEKLKDIIESTAANGGVLMIPAFSLERTQEFLFEIETLMKQSKIPILPVYLDSPLAIKVTDIYHKYEDYFNKEAQHIVSSSDEIFSFIQLQRTLKTDESKAIRNSKNPKIIIAGSGMSNGGRILHHEKLYLSDPKNTLLIVSYQAPGSLGREFQEGAKKVTILGREITVKARVEFLEGYSSHRDADGLFEFVEPLANTVKKVFVTMGEPKSSTVFTQRLRDYLDIDAVAPQQGDSVELEF